VNFAHPGASDARRARSPAPHIARTLRKYCGNVANFYHRDECRQARKMRGTVMTIFNIYAL